MSRVGGLKRTTNALMPLRLFIETGSRTVQGPESVQAGTEAGGSTRVRQGPRSEPSGLVTGESVRGRDEGGLSPSPSPNTGVAEARRRGRTVGGQQETPAALLAQRNRHLARRERRRQVYKGGATGAGDQQSVLGGTNWKEPNRRELEGGGT